MAQYHTYLPSTLQFCARGDYWLQLHDISEEIYSGYKSLHMTFQSDEGYKRISRHKIYQGTQSEKIWDNSDTTKK